MYWQLHTHGRVCVIVKGDGQDNDAFTEPYDKNDKLIQLGNVNPFHSLSLTARSTFKAETSVLCD